jgi:hypothetical protein
MITFLAAMALAAPNPKAIDAPRHAYAACIKSFESNQLKEKVEPSAYGEAVKAACPSEAAAFTAALISYDVAMGTKRAAAAANAARDLEDYQLTSVDRYTDIFTHP